MWRATFWTVTTALMALAIFLIGPIGAVGGELYASGGLAKLVSYLVFFVAPLPPYIVGLAALFVYDLKFNVLSVEGDESFRDWDDEEGDK
jgi:ABC-type dipeptide/oligopeptide/nickel transport system permease component